MRLSSVREDVPADVVPLSLVVQHEFTNLSRDLCSLPVTFTTPGSLGLIRRDRSLDGPDCVGRSPQVVSCDMSHCCGLSSSESCELGRIRKSTCRGIRGECCSPGLAHTCLASDPGASKVDGVARSAVARLVLFKQVEDVLGADDGPFRQQPVIFVCQRPATTDGDQSGVTLFREDRHGHVMAVLS